MKKKLKLIIKITSAGIIVWTIYFMIKNIIEYKLYEPFGLVFLLLISILFALGIGIDSIKDNMALNKLVGNTIIVDLILSGLFIVYVLVRLTLINLPLMIAWALANYLMILL